MDEGFVPEVSVPVRSGRGAAFNPPSRFEAFSYEEDAATLETDELRKIPTRFYSDSSRSALARNTSPDVPFTYSLNPYRGCEHGCIYCYARPTHEYLGFSAGIDFETRILVKREAALLLSRTFESGSWEPQVVALSGNTDPYQPVERKLGLTRRCLEVFSNYGNPVTIITKNQLVLRDKDVLLELTDRKLVHVTISITSLRPEVIRVMEPRTTSPAARFRTIEALANAGISVGVNVAPVIPGLTDEDMPEIIRRAAECGARRANYIVVRLPGAVRPLFLEWVHREFPDRAGKIIARLRDVRSGKLSDPRFKKRHTGEGEWSRVLNRLFHLSLAASRMDNKPTRLSTEHFRRSTDRQFDLFQ